MPVPPVSPPSVSSYSLRRLAFVRRPALLLVGVFVLQLAFVASYVGAFHHPTPHHLKVVVVAPVGASQTAAAEVEGALDALPGAPLDATVAATRADALARLHDRKEAAVLALGTGSQDHLYVASAGGAAESEAAEQVLTAFLASTGRTLATTDEVPAAYGDARGLSAFYLAVGWVVGGYLAASILGITAGARPLNRFRAAARLIGLAIYAIAGGIGGALLAGPVIGALPGHFLPLAAFGALLIFGVGAATAAFQTWLGILGIGLAIALFVIVGNPSAGGAYPKSLLPAFWANTGPWLPPGAATTGIRGIVYFGGAGTAIASIVLAAWAVAGSLVTLLGAGNEPEPEQRADPASSAR